MNLLTVTLTDSDLLLVLHLQLQIYKIKFRVYLLNFIDINIIMMWYLYWYSCRIFNTNRE